MSRELDMLVARKQMLAARASLQRLKAAHEIGKIRQATRLPRLLIVAFLLARRFF